MTVMEAKVKVALSGDTIVLHNVNNPSQERILSLAFVSAPRLRREGDEVSSLEYDQTYIPFFGEIQLLKQAMIPQ